MNRREVLRAGVGSLAGIAGTAGIGGSLLAPRSAWAATDWPTKPIRAVVPYAAGSATDLVPRTIFDRVAAQVGQSIVVENRPGGGTTVASAQVAKSDPD